MWHYTEGLRNWSPVWPGHGIRVLPGPSSMWFDATGKRFRAPDWPGYDTLHTLGSITASGYDYVTAKAKITVDPLKPVFSR